MIIFSQLYFSLLCAVVLLPLVHAHSIDNRRLLRVEPLTSVKFDIAPRNDHFYTKRNLTPNPTYEPSFRAVEHDDVLRIALQAYNQTFHLHLTPNVDLFHPEAVTFRDGRSEPLRPEEFRVFRGHVVDDRFTDERWLGDQAGVARDEFNLKDQIGVLGWARIVIRHDLKHLDSLVFEGAFQTQGDLYHVKTLSNYKLSKRADDAGLTNEEKTHMIVYRDSDTTRVEAPFAKRLDHHEEKGESQCGYDRLFPNKVSSPVFDMGHPATREMGIYASRDTFDTSIFGGKSLAKRQNAGCPTTKKIAYMGAAADCTYTRYYQSPDKARIQIISDWNMASAVYERSFNVALGLINITIMDEACPSTISNDIAWNRPCSDSYPIGDRLSDFSRWRATMSGDGASLWHLMTSCATGVEVGIAWLKQLCVTEATAQTQSGVTQYVSGTGVSSIIRDEWKVVAHEIGHGFGAIHDCTSSNCPCSGSSCQCCPLSSTQCDAGGTYIMNPTSNVSSQDFSPCSISTVCSLYPSLGTCLEDPGSRTVKTLQMCGNGIKEEGEDCDTAGRDTSCCDPTTCKFKAGAVCEDSNDLCCNQCQLRPKGAVCRVAATSCDTEEVCPGDSATCPPDQHLNDGDSCGQGLQCASGQCTSRDEQCKARGSVMNVTRTCSTRSDSCQLMCNNPSGMGCIVFNGRFLDGTPCGVGGKCRNGSCDMGDIGNQAKNWIENHKEIVIPVAVVLGLLLLLCLGRCLLCGCFGYSGYRNRKQAVVTTSMAYPVSQPTSAYQPLPSPLPVASGTGAPGPAPAPPIHRPNDWVDPAVYNGAPAPPYPHPPVYPTTPIHPPSSPQQNVHLNANHPGSPVLSPPAAWTTAPTMPVPQPPPSAAH